MDELQSKCILIIWRAGYTNKQGKQSREMDRRVLPPWLKLAGTRGVYMPPVKASADTIGEQALTP